MLKFQLPIQKGRSLNILCLGAHSDDIEIGCGGTILRILEEKRLLWVPIFKYCSELKEQDGTITVIFITNTGFVACQKRYPLEQNPLKTGAIGSRVFLIKGTKKADQSGLVV